jgi:hypothetical protein
VSLAGSSTRDRICSVTVTASALIASTVTDVNAFKAAVAAASGAEGAVVAITSFEQTAALEAQVPGSLADYEAPAAQLQFRTGVASALSVDLSAVSELTVVATRRRRLATVIAVSRATAAAAAAAAAAALSPQPLRRRLEDDPSVTISYDVTVEGPSAAADVAAATADLTTFAQALTEAINQVPGGSLSIDASLVTLAPPVISTAIEYEVIVETTDPEAVSEKMAAATLLCSFRFAFVLSLSWQIIVFRTKTQRTGVCEQVSAVQSELESSGYELVVPSATESETEDDDNTVDGDGGGDEDAQAAAINIGGKTSSARRGGVSAVLMAMVLLGATAAAV